MTIALFSAVVYRKTIWFLAVRTEKLASPKPSDRLGTVELPRTKPASYNSQVSHLTFTSGRKICRKV